MAESTPSRTSVKDLFDLSGRFAIITGAGQGIGLDIAHAYAEQGANVAIWYNSNSEAIQRAEEICAKYGVKCKAYKVGVTEEDEVRKAVDSQVEEFGGHLDILVANAGVAWTVGPILGNDPSNPDSRPDISNYENVTKTNIDGVFYCARAAGVHFRRQQLEKPTFRGTFIATASMSGHIVNLPQMQSVYNMSKAAVVHLCKSLAVEWAEFARVNTVSPGYIITEIGNFVPLEQKKQWHEKTPMKREGYTHELKGAYLLLASDAGSYMTGSDIIVDGGYCAP
ncbi:hypothetical protein H072_6216 [Dactylellina haptotyla CBS 200.50]|uniref:L-xylulose reductase n=1 Tax=Dactylellina haptotyla (strain CBS 200.50) TaxID=1284197 RepID=S8AFJ4_DACHA|nr:hypothetical protein H072_6216 [Dactylellina haptotyla CBS 200.50]